MGTPLHCRVVKEQSICTHISLLATSWGRPGLSWGILGPSWAVLGPSWGRLGPSWGHPRAVLGRLGAVLGRLGAVLGPSWGRPGPSWGRPGVVLSTNLESHLAVCGYCLLGEQKFHTRITLHIFTRAPLDILLHKGIRLWLSEQMLTSTLPYFLRLHALDKLSVLGMRDKKHPT